MDLTASKRKGMPSSDFALPGEKEFPLTDKQHDILAEEFVGRALKAGHITQAQADLIRSEAKRRLAAMKK